MKLRVALQISSYFVAGNNRKISYAVNIVKGLVASSLVGHFWLKVYLLRQTSLVVF